MQLFHILVVFSVSLGLGSAQFGEVLTYQSMRLLGHSPAMQLVNLRYRNLSKIEVSSLEGFEHMTYLDMSHNNLDKLDGNAFHDLIQLKTLDLSYNKFESLNRTLFQGLFQLTHLFIESNNIVSINQYTLLNLANLRQVCLFKNPASQLFPTQMKSLCRSSSNCVISLSQSCYDFESLMPEEGILEVCSNKSAQSTSLAQIPASAQTFPSCPTCPTTIASTTTTTISTTTTPPTTTTTTTTTTTAMATWGNFKLFANYYV